MHYCCILETPYSIQTYSGEYPISSPVLSFMPYRLHRQAMKVALSKIKQPQQALCNS